MLSDLLKLTDAELLELAPDATHQHKKGGLYRYIGPVRNSATNRILRLNGMVQVGYEHVYPFQRDVWIRASPEFFDGRFRELVR